MVNLLEFFENSWLIIFFISIVFIFILIFRDLRTHTRKIKYWSRRSYLKTLPRISLTYQHFSRRGDLLTLTNQSMCKSIQNDMTNLLKIKQGFSDKEVKKLLQNRKELYTILPNENVVLFLYDLNTWLETVVPKQSLVKKFFGSIRRVIKEDHVKDVNFFLELATVIYDFRKLTE